MKLGHRIARLERTAGITGSCAACGGEGLGRIAHMLGDEDLSGPRGCPGCGKDRILRYTIFNPDLIPDEGKRRLRAPFGNSPTTKAEQPCR